MIDLRRLKLIGKNASYQIGNLIFNVVVLDIKEGFFGSIRCQITPLRGSGELWVSREDINIHVEKNDF